MKSFLINIISLCVILMGIPISLYAQTTVKGTVIDEEGVPVVGASVYVIGTNRYTQTDRNGEWTLQVEDPETAVIEVSCLGYKSSNETVAGRSILVISLRESFEELEAAVHVGYGTQRKADLTGSVTALSKDDIGENRTIVYVPSALAGLVPGLRVQQTTGKPGDESVTMRLRGTGSFTSSASSPLVILDGIEWNMSDINPDDIESISVLKDAASTAIYGSRAANGVILITTKSGREGKPTISYSFKGIWQKPYYNVKLVSNSGDYFEYINEASEQAGEGRVYSQTTIDLWRAAEADPYGLNEYGVPNHIAYPNTDWFDEIYNTGFAQEHNVSVSGGSKNIRYLFSAAFLDNTGVMAKYLDSSSQKASFRSNVEADVTKWFTLGTRIYGQFVNVGSANLSTGYENALGLTPYIYPGTPNKWGIAATSEGRSGQNFYADAYFQDGKTSRYTLNASVYAKVRPYKGISIEGTVNYSPGLELLHESTAENTGRWDYVRDRRSSSANLETATVTDYAGRNYRASTELLVKYEATFNQNHNFSALLGYSTEIEKSWGFGHSMQGATDWYLTDGSTYAEVYSTTNGATKGWAMRSYFARANYAYKDRYLFEANVRVDGSSVFGKSNRYGVFPSFSAGWKIHEEPWMESAAGWLSQLKLRASWGEAGNNQGIGYYDWQASYSEGDVVLGGTSTTALYITSISNINLKWETTSSLDIGIDAGFFNNRLTAEIDYYRKDTRDILFSPTTYLTMGGFSSAPQNRGRMWNQGVELELKWRDTVGDFFYYIGANISYNKNLVTKFKGKLVSYTDGSGNYHTNFYDVAEGWGGGKYADEQVQGFLVEGHQIGEYYRFKLYRGTGAGYTGGGVDPNAGPKDGMIRTEADMAWVQAMIDSGYKFQGGTTIAKNQLWYGDFIYADLNGDGNYGDDDDRAFAGYSWIPPYTYGINLGFAWKGLEFSMTWSGAFDYHLIWTATYYNTSALYTGMAIGKGVVEDHYYYDPDNPDDPRTNITGKRPRIYAYDKNTEFSDYYDYNANYLKLKNVTIAYTIPQKWTRKCFINQLKVFASGENILTITKFPGWDPEVGREACPDYPLMSQFTVGAQITF